ncbi:hypothetical protein D3C85_883960 [compost metagenome]
MQAYDSLGMSRDFGDLVHIQIGGIGREDDILANQRLDLAQQILFDCEVFENGLDHQLGRGELCPVGAGIQPGQLAIGPVLTDSSCLDAPLVVAGNPLLAPLEGGGVLLQQHDLESGLKESQGNAAAHRAGSDHRHAVDRARLALLQLYALARQALGEKQMAEGESLGRQAKTLEHFTLGSQRKVDGHGSRTQHGLDGGTDLRAILAGLEGLGANLFQLLGVTGRGIQIPNPALACHATQIIDCEARQIAVGDSIDHAECTGIRSLYPGAGTDQLDGLGDACQPRQALGPPCAGDHTQGHFGQAQHTVFRRHTGIASQCQLEAATERSTMDCRDDGFAAMFDGADDIR